jgi:hypothetical protein
MMNVCCGNKPVIPIDEDLLIFKISVVVLVTLYTLLKLLVCKNKLVVSTTSFAFASIQELVTVVTGKLKVAISA